MTATKDKKKVEHHYWRVFVTYSDGETSGNRVFKDRSKAERWAARQEKSGVVKKVALEAFMRTLMPPRRFARAKATLIRTDWQHRFP